MIVQTKEKNLYILTEERPKEEVVSFIAKKYAQDAGKECKNGKIKITPVIEKGKFCFKWIIQGIKIEGIDKIIVENVSGTSSFVDFLVFVENQDPDPKTSKPLYVIEETKTNPSESRNVSVFQRMAKFVFVEQYPLMKDSEKIMLYTIRRPYFTYPPTFDFGLKSMKTLDVNPVFLQNQYMNGLNVNKDGKLDEPGFKDFDELMKLKNELSTDRDDNIPIRINIEEEIKGEVEKISISAKLEKSGGFDYDPNIGAVSLLSFLSKKLCKSIKQIIIKEHCCDGYKNSKNVEIDSIKDEVERSKGKFVKICNALENNFKVKISLDGIKMLEEGLNSEYWHKEITGEKIGTIFLHLALLKKYHVIYEQHAGTERGYFVTPVYFLGQYGKEYDELFKTYQEYSQKNLDQDDFKNLLKKKNGLQDLPKDKSSKKIFGSNNSCKTFHIPDLILLDIENKMILILEGEKAENVYKKDKGVNQLPLFDDLKKFYLEKYYPKYDVEKFVVLYGDEELPSEMSEDDKKKVIFRLKTDGSMITTDTCPQSIKDVISKLQK